MFLLYHKISTAHVDGYAHEAFDNLNRQLSATSAGTANAITKAFETFKGELEIATKRKLKRARKRGNTISQVTWRTPSKAELEQQSANSNEEKSVNLRNQ